MTTNGNTLTYRVERLEKDFCAMETKLDRILENHLPHISSEVESLKARITTLSIINVGAVILGLLFGKFL